MTRTRVGTAIVGVLLMAITGCAGHSGTSASTSSVSGCEVAQPAGSVRLTQADSGRTICVVWGQPLEIYLQGSDTDMWTPIVGSGTALQIAPNGKGTLMRGVTAGFFVAAAAGSQTLTSSRPTCSGSGVKCAGPTHFTITVIVR